MQILDSKILSKLAKIDIVNMTSRASASHIGSAFSVVDILSVLYSTILKISPETVRSQNRDFLILSKGHAAAAQYAILANLGYFPKSFLDEYCQDDSMLGGHVNSSVPGVELATGSLGHGLPYGIGIALALQKQELDNRVIVVMSDGECDEGTTWESALIANHHDLRNLTVVIDRNGLQSLTTTELTLKLEPFEQKWRSFGWNVEEVNGHSHEDLRKTLSIRNGPLCIIANSTKGKGVDFMENQISWHYKSPNSDQAKLAVQQIENNLHA